jgi:co-chaperonin GroES (HSP10)
VNYEPWKDNVFLLLEKGNRETASGIVLPDSALNSEFGSKLLSAMVMKAGPGGFDSNSDYWAVDVCQGDRVVIAWDAGEVVIVGEDIEQASAPELGLGTEIRIVRNNEIVGIVDE